RNRGAGAAARRRLLPPAAAQPAAPCRFDRHTRPPACAQITAQVKAICNGDWRLANGSQVAFSTLAVLDIFAPPRGDWLAAPVASAVARRSASNYCCSGFMLQR